MQIEIRTDIICHPGPSQKAKLIGYSTNYFPKNKMLVKINMYAECSLQEKKHP